MTPQPDVSSPQRVHMLVTGMVQGVGFRYFTVMAARRYGLTGWVRNRRDGSVELEAQGERADLDRFSKTIEAGPRWSRVEHVTIDSLAPIVGESGFSVHADG